MILIYGHSCGDTCTLPNPKIAHIIRNIMNFYLSTPIAKINAILRKYK